MCLQVWGVLQPNVSATVQIVNDFARLVRIRWKYFSLSSAADSAHKKFQGNTCTLLVCMRYPKINSLKSWERSFPLRNCHPGSNSVKIWRSSTFFSGGGPTQITGLFLPLMFSRKFFSICPFTSFCLPGAGYARESSHYTCFLLRLKARL